jgi:hypothetical protein
MLSPALVERSRDAFAIDEADSTVDLDKLAATARSRSSTSARRTRPRRNEQSGGPSRPDLGMWRPGRVCCDDELAEAFPFCPNSCGIK